MWTLFAILFFTISSAASSSAHGFQEVFEGSLTGVSLGPVAWGDYDNN